MYEPESDQKIESQRKSLILPPINMRMNEPSELLVERTTAQHIISPFDFNPPDFGPNIGSTTRRESLVQVTDQ